jgi:class 3 adenylate cyclase
VPTCDNVAAPHLAEHLERIMPDLPSGTVTFLFTDIEGSTASLGDFADLEARLDARFAALQADFAAFGEGAKNGFGRFWQATVDTATSTHPPASRGLGAAVQS